MFVVFWFPKAGVLLLKFSYKDFFEKFPANKKNSENKKVFFCNSNCGGHTEENIAQQKFLHTGQSNETTPKISRIGKVK